MAIRKFRKNLKPFIWIITILFIMSSAVMYYGQIKNKEQGPKQYAFKLNGKEIPRISVERIKSNIANSYSQSAGVQIDGNLVGIIAVDEEITKSLTLDLADNMKIKVSDKEINEEYDNIKKSIGDDEQFKRLLSAQGFTKASLKKEIEDNKKINKLLETMQDQAKASDEELQKYFQENKYGRFRDKNFETSKEEIQKDYAQEKAMEQYAIEIEKLKKSAKIEDVQTEYQGDIPKVEKEIQGLVFTNVDMAKKVLMNMIQRRVSLEEAQKGADEQLNNHMKLIAKAIEKGVKVDENLPVDVKMVAYSKGLLNVLRDEVAVNNKDVKKFFTENKDKYDREATIDANIAVLNIQASDEDKKAAKLKAEELLKKATKDNFADLAKENSKDTGSAVNGGDLGWFTKELMVAPFAEASFKGKKGEIYPEIVETDFGYHVVFVKDKKSENGKEEVNAAHILIIPEISENTKKVASDNVVKLIEGLNLKLQPFDKLKEANKDIIYAEKMSKITMDGYLQGVGYNEKLVKHLFDSKVGGYSSLEEKERIYIVEKVSEEPAFDAKIEDPVVYEKVASDYKTKKALEIVETIVKNDK